MRPGPPGGDATQRGPIRQNRLPANPTRPEPIGRTWRGMTPCGAAPIRQNRLPANPTRPEPIGEDLARDDAMRRGSAQDPARPAPGQPQRPLRPGPTWELVSGERIPRSGVACGDGRGAAWRAGCAARTGARVRPPGSILEHGRIRRRRRFRLGRPGAAARRVRGPSRAWQGSVNEAAAGRRPWSVPRRGGPGSRRRRALQAAAIGVPVAVIVTVGPAR